MGIGIASRTVTPPQPRVDGRGRDGPYGPPPAQIPACGFPAPGSCRRSNATGAGGLGRPLPSRSAGSPPRGHAGSGAGSGACVAARLPSDRPPSLHHLRRRSGSALFEASSVLRSRPTPPAFLSGSARSSFPPRPGTATAVAGGRRSPRFRRVPFRRDVVFDPGGATAPRLAAPHMLPSTFPTASASATSGISGLNTHPAGSLCTLRSRRRRRPRNTRYRATRYRLTRAGLPPAGTRQLCLAHWKPPLR
jgi:hypothetical protein